MPTRLGRYAVRRRIGSGGFATVWLAYDEQLDAPVAVKVLAENWTEDHHVRTRFVEEGRYLRRVESPHVVTVYDAGELDDGRPYLVMGYADQGTLADRLQDGGLTLAQGIEVVRQVGAGLQALHDRNILHRDVKPANVLFRSVADAHGTGIRAMLGDLGLGKALDASSRLTMIAGTPSYVAPEQAQGESPDSRADQYSLGVLTYLLLSGRTPWQHASLNAAADPAPPPPLSTPERTFAPEVEQVVGRALARDRDQRWPTVEQYVAALTAALAGDPGIPPPGALDTRWLPLDPELTRPGERPSAPDSPVQRSTTAAPAGRRRRRAPLLVAGVLAAAVGLGAGLAGGWFGVRAMPRDVTLTDARDSLEVTVPDGWDVVAPEPWSPPDQSGTYAALSAGTVRGWQRDGEGVFLGVLPTDRLPTLLPQHPECASTEPMIDGSSGDGSGRAATRTVYFAGCPGFTIERVVRIADNRVLWVQVRSDSRAEANDVLASVEVHGFG